jgi:YfiH family protein
MSRAEFTGVFYAAGGLEAVQSRSIELVLITSPLLEVPHGFTTREGGVSQGPYASLNLSLSTGDRPEHVGENQRRVLERFGNPPVAALDQLHGSEVHAVEGPGVWPGDGLLTDRPGLLLRVGVADCYPLLLHDPVRRVVGALHAGWRGVVAGILPAALRLMQERYGSRCRDIRVALGPGAGPGFQVGPEVAEAFAQVGLETFRPDPSTPGRFCLDLASALRQQALGLGIRSEHLWSSGADTLRDPRFFSHRRERGLTGRMWGLIQLPANPPPP